MKKKLAIILSALILSASILPFEISVSAKENDAPLVIPAIQQWEGDSGNFIPNQNTVLVNTSGSSSVDKAKGFFADLLELNVTVSETAAGNNEIVFIIDTSLLNEVGEEGYVIVASENRIEISAVTDIGLLYGGITVAQSVYSSGFFPCGKAIDYPAYPVRSGMIDVARLYMPIESLEEITKYMAWYKLNELHVHINDNGENDYSAFRLESDVPGLTSKDGYYTKEEYRQFQIDALEYGVNIITEIDSPYHSACFANVELGAESPKMLTEADGVYSWIAGKTLDIRDETTVKFIENLFTEYLGGDDPVIVNKTIHIGMDEFPTNSEFKSAMEAYLNRIIRHVNSLGYKARFWSGMGSGGCLNGAQIEEALDFETNYWDESLSGPSETVALNCDIINTTNTYLYIVPGKTGAVVEDFEDYFGYDSLQFIYDRWEINYYNVWASTPEFISADDERLKGACFAIWNDYGSAWYGLTYRDVVDRVRGAVSIIAEKTWYGTTRGKRSFADFYSRYLALSERDGFIDLFNRKLPQGGIALDFDSEIPAYATFNGVTENGEFVLDGSSYISLEPAVYGFPNTLKFKITLDEYPSERTALFSGYETEGIDIFIDADGTVGFKSKISETDSYVFTFDYKLPLREKTDLIFTCDMFNTKLIADGVCYESVNDHEILVPSQYRERKYSTLTIPLSKIGFGIKGRLDDLSVSAETVDFSAYTYGSNLALNGTATASGSLDEEKYPASNAIDNSSKKRFMFPDDADEQWLEIDLGLTAPVNKIEISFYQAVGNYEVYVSKDGIDYEKIHEITDGSEGKGRVDKIKFEKARNIRYVKYVQLKRMAEDNKSGGIIEFRIYAPDSDYYRDYYSSLAVLYREMDSSNPNKKVLNEKLTELDKIMDSKQIYIGVLSSVTEEIDALINSNEALKGSAERSKEPTVSNDTQNENNYSKHNLLTIIGGIAAATVAVVAAILIIRKRRK